MAEDDPALSAEPQAQLRVATDWPLFLHQVQQISKHMWPWMQRRASLEKLKETLRLERERLETEKHNALNNLQNWIRSPGILDPSGTISDHRARIKFASNRVDKAFSELEDFDRDYGKKLNKSHEAYKDHVKELQDSFPILDDFIPEEVLRFVLSRLSASRLETLLSGNNGIQFWYETSWSEANASHTSIPASPAPASSLPPPPRRSASSRATSLEREQREEGPVKTPEDGGTINVRLAGIPIPAGGVASSSSTEEAAVCQHTRALVTPRPSRTR